jgi:hypothetical protein
VAMVLDVDSDKPDDFSQTDAEGLRKIVEIVERLIQKTKPLCTGSAEVLLGLKVRS